MTDTQLAPDPDYDEWSQELTYQAQQEQDEAMHEEEAAGSDERGMVSGLGKARPILERTGETK